MKKYFLLAFLLVGALVLAGPVCKNTAEKKAEESIEKTTGGKADVDVDDNSIKINTNEGTFEAGEKVDLPSGFPSDVYVVGGTIMTAATTTEDSYSVSIQTSKSVSSINDDYQSKLKNEGWEITMTFNYQGGSTIGAEKGDRTVTVSITEGDDGKAVVILGVMKKEG